MGQLYAGSGEVVIPGVIDEASSRRVLTMEYVAGLSPDEACAPGQDQGLRDRWGAVLYVFLLRGLFDHRLLHADPNLSNFSFLPDGRVVVYDFGCVKAVPRTLVRGYRALSRAALDGRRDDFPALLEEMGVRTEPGEVLSDELIAPAADLVLEVLGEGVPYRFGGDDEIFRRLLEVCLLYTSPSPRDS